MKPALNALLALVATFLFATTASASVSPEEVDGATTVTPVQAADLFDQGVPFVDVRSDTDWDAGRVAGAYHLELNSVYSEQALLEIAGHGDPVVIYCNGHSCLRSSDATALAVGWGFTNVHYMRDGYPAWETEGFPIE